MGEIVFKVIWTKGTSQQSRYFSTRKEADQFKIKIDSALRLLGYTDNMATINEICLGE